MPLCSICNTPALSGVCNSCSNTPACGRCRTLLSSIEIKWRTGLCDNCYTSKPSHQPQCGLCNANLTHKEQGYQTGLCDTCHDKKTAAKQQQIQQQLTDKVKGRLSTTCDSCQSASPDSIKANGLCDTCRSNKVMQVIPTITTVRNLSLEDVAFCISTGTLPPDAKFPETVYGRVHCYRNDTTVDKISKGTILPNDRPTTFVLGPSGLETCVGKRFDALTAAGLSKEHVVSQIQKKRMFGMLLFETQPNLCPITADWSGLWSLCKHHYPAVWKLLQIHTTYLSAVSWQDLSDGRFKETVTAALKCGLSPSAAYLASNNTALDARMWLAYEIYCSELYTGNGWTVDDNGKRQLKEYFVNNAPLSMVKNWKWVEIPVSLSEAATAPAPQTWSMQKKNCELVEVQRGTAEFNSVVARMHETLSKTVLKIERVQNVMLWQNYCNEKEQVSRWNGKPARELRLFHGTSSASPDCIYASQTGFDMRFCRSGLWGIAVYFAQNAAYSDSYSYQNGPHRQFFLASVIVGDAYQCSTDGSLRMPPLKTGTTTRYDSVTGNTGGSDVFMIYSNGRAYPEYLITYQ